MGGAEERVACLEGLLVDVLRGDYVSRLISPSVLVGDGEDVISSSLPLTVLIGRGWP